MSYESSFINNIPENISCIKKVKNNNSNFYSKMKNKYKKQEDINHENLVKTLAENNPSFINTYLTSKNFYNNDFIFEKKPKETEGLKTINIHKELNNELKEKGYNNLYIDGGLTVQSFLKEDLVDELIITTIPILLGSGIRLFGELERALEFRCTKSERYSNGICQNSFERYSS